MEKVEEFLAKEDSGDIDSFHPADSISRNHIQQ
jgi:hypothetical protein